MATAEIGTERAVLSYAIVDPKRWMPLIKKLERRHFWFEETWLVFRVLLRMWNRGVEIKPSSVVEQIEPTLFNTPEAIAGIVCEYRMGEFDRRLKRLNKLADLRIIE